MKICAGSNQITTENTYQKNERKKLDISNPESRIQEESVKLEISSQGMKALQQDEKLAYLQQSQTPAKKLHRIIPNIKVNDKLEKSLAGVDEKIVDAAYSVISNNFLPHNIGTLTEDERQELISVGLEQAKYLSQKLGGGKATDFMDAMTTIAKYGMNGTTDKEGNVSYDIRWGAKVGEPDDNYNTDELMKKTDPKSYETYNSMYEEALKKNDISLFQKAAKFWLDWSAKMNQSNPKVFEDAKKDMTDWKDNVDKTQLNTQYTNTDLTDLNLFMESIMQQRGKLSQSMLQDNLTAFAKVLGE